MRKTALQLNLWVFIAFSLNLHANANPLPGSNNAILANNNLVSVTYIGSAGFLIESGSKKIMVDTTISEPVVDEIDEPVLPYHPNPSNGCLYVSNQGMDLISKTEIIDLSGKCLSSQPHGNSKSISMDLKGLPGGFYIL